MNANIDVPLDAEEFQKLVREGSFEQALAALEEVVAYLERGRLSMEQSVSWYEIGLGLTKRCADLLQQAELRISTIEDRYAVTVHGDAPWDADES